VGSNPTLPAILGLGLGSQPSSSLGVSTMRGRMENNEGSNPSRSTFFLTDSPSLIRYPMDDFKRNADVFGSRYKCPCCGPKPGKEKDTFRRVVRRRMKALTRKAIDTAIVEGI